MTCKARIAASRGNTTSGYSMPLNKLTEGVEGDGVNQRQADSLETPENCQHIADVGL